MYGKFTKKKKKFEGKERRNGGKLNIWIPSFRIYSYEEKNKKAKLLFVNQLKFSLSLIGKESGKLTDAD